MLTGRRVHRCGGTAEPDLGGARAGAGQLWELPEGKHTGALDEAPEEYERRVIGFFGRRLLGSS